MKQVLQNFETGVTFLLDGPVPSLHPGKILIQSHVSLISAGTERMLVDFGKASLLRKARQQPEKVKEVLKKVHTDGIAATIDAVRSKLSQPIPMGYCNVGVVLGVGKNVSGYQVGDRVVSNGSHAEIVSASPNLCAKIPCNVSDETAAFAILSSIGLQGIRLAQPTLGETFAVIGVGLIGLLTVQLLKAHGCRVLAIDFDDKKLEIARAFGAEIVSLSQGKDPISISRALSKDQGIDGVLITASTHSSDPISQAARMSRKRGRIVLVGVSGLNLNRSEFYEKELSFQVSCSYGPGRYDPAYEEEGRDYPLGFVRWTEQRNFEAILELMAEEKLTIDPLISHRFPFEEAPKAYSVLLEDKHTLGILLQYIPQDSTQEKTVSLSSNIVPISKKDIPVVGMIGAGNYASRTLLPALKKTGINTKFHTLFTSNGTSSAVQGKKFGFLYASTDLETLWDTAEINTVVIATRHNTHASLVINALKAGKHVYVEKPLALTLNELQEIQDTYNALIRTKRAPLLMVGFNRRFSPHIQKIKSLLSQTQEPKSCIITINAGYIPPSHWVQDQTIGGGRIVGEACHFIDLMRYLVGYPIISVQVQHIGRHTGDSSIVEDKASIMLGFSDGSFGTIHYLANGAVSFPKERIEIFVAQKILQLDNFRKLKGYDWKGFRKMSLWRQDKGQVSCIKSFLSSIKHGEPAPIPYEEILEVAKVTVQAAEMIRNS